MSVSRAAACRTHLRPASLPNDPASAGEVGASHCWAATRTQFMSPGAFEVEAEASGDMGDPCVVVSAFIDPATDNDPSHQAWWSWRIDRYGIDTAARFLVVIELDRVAQQPERD